MTTKCKSAGDWWYYLVVGTIPMVVFVWPKDKNAFTEAVGSPT